MTKTPIGLRRGFVLITRPDQDAARTLAELRRRGLRAAAAPSLTIEPIPGPPPAGASEATALVVTSGNALQALASAPDWQPTGLSVTLAVGDRTAALARQAGLPNPVSASGDSADLVRLSKQLLPPGSHILQVAGEALGLALTRALEEQGHRVTRWETYRTARAARLNGQARWLIGRRRAAAVLLLSPRSAAAFATLLGKHRLWPAARAMTFACISPATADTLLDSAGPNPLLTLCIAQKPTLTHTIDALLKGSSGRRRAGPG